MVGKLPHSVKISYFRFLLSYLYPQLLAKTSSKLNPVLEVRLSRGRLRLDSDNSTYSYEDLYDTFYTPFTKLNMSNQRLNKVLVLGTGLCSVPYMLYYHFNQRCRFVTVDIDDAVINLSRQFLPPELLQHLDFMCADAFEFVEHDAQLYDLIAMDIFIDTQTPSKFRSAEFLELLKKRLQPNGLLLYNTMVNHQDLGRTANNFYRSTFKQVFPNAYAFRTSGNRVLAFKKSEK